MADKKPPTPTEPATPRKLWKPSRVTQATAAVERTLAEHGLEPAEIRRVFRFIESGLPPETLPPTEPPNRNVTMLGGDTPPEWAKTS